jgi:hypothetical protein
MCEEGRDQEQLRPNGAQILEGSENSSCAAAAVGLVDVGEGLRDRENSRASLEEDCAFGPERAKPDGGRPGLRAQAMRAYLIALRAFETYGSTGVGPARDGSLISAHYLSIRHWRAHKGHRPSTGRYRLRAARDSRVQPLRAKTRSRG